MRCVKLSSLFVVSAFVLYFSSGIISVHESPDIDGLLHTVLDFYGGKSAPELKGMKYESSFWLHKITQLEQIVLNRTNNNNLTEMSCTICDVKNLPLNISGVEEIYFLLSILHRKLSRYGKSWKYLMASKSIRRNILEPTPFLNEEGIQEMKLLFDNKISFPIDVVNYTQPVFIIGMAGAGQELLAELLSNHSRIFRMGQYQEGLEQEITYKTPFLNISKYRDEIIHAIKISSEQNKDSYDDNNDGSSNNNADYLKSTMRKLREDLIRELWNQVTCKDNTVLHPIEQDDEIFESSNETRVESELLCGLSRESLQRNYYLIDPYPLNLFKIPWIYLLFPQAKIVHILRSPQDTLLNLFFSRFHDDLRWSWVYDIHDAISAYGGYVQVMNYIYHNIGTDRILDVYYEDLYDNPCLTLTNILTQLDISDTTIPFCREEIPLSPHSQSGQSSTVTRHPALTAPHLAPGEWKNYAREFGSIHSMIAATMKANGWARFGGRVMNNLSAGDEARVLYGAQYYDNGLLDGNAPGSVLDRCTCEAEKAAEESVDKSKTRTSKKKNKAISKKKSKRKMASKSSEDSHRKGSSRSAGADGKEAVEARVLPRRGVSGWKDVKLPYNRTQLGTMLEQLNLKVGVEIGVQKGEYSETILEAWSSCQKYYLIDVWAPQEMYFDGSNTDLNSHERFMQMTRERVKKYELRAENPVEIVILRNFSTDAVDYIADNSVDFVYIDARHDYCAVKEDIALYWPKLRPGGIFAGHDYLSQTNIEQTPSHKHERWDICADGSIERGAVKGAVDDFLDETGLFVATTVETSTFPTWIVRKPLV